MGTVYGDQRQVVQKVGTLGLARVKQNRALVASEMAL